MPEELSREESPSPSSFVGKLDLRSLARVGWLPILAHGGLLSTWDLAGNLTATLFWLGLAFAGLTVASHKLATAKSTVGAQILLVAGLLRLLMLPLPATLSDDIGRYLWDGKVVNAGWNPYLYEPDAAELSGLRDEDWGRLPHRQVPSVYPPLAMAVFSVASRFPASPLMLKLWLAAMDIAACALLLTLTRTLDIPASRVVWYAWNPLVTLEVAGMGHIDALGVLFMVLVAVCLYRRPRWVVGAALAAAGGVLTKLVPMVGIPSWARQSERPWLFLSLAVAVSMAALVPVVVSSGGVPAGLVSYGVSWEFDGPLYEPLWRLVDRLQIPSATSGLLDWLKIRSGRHELWNHFYPLNYPQLWAKALLGVVLLLALGRSIFRRLPLLGMLWIFGSVVVCSATVYPWYLLWVIPWAALAGNRAWLVASATVMLSYIPQFTGVSLFPWIYLAVWVPPLATWVSQRWFSA